MDKLDEMIFAGIEKDKINSGDEGFHWKSHGRSATIYYVCDMSIVPIACEMSGVDYLDALIYGETEHIRRRYFVKERKSENLSVEESLRIQSLLVEWLAEKRIRHDIDIGK